MDNRWRVFSDVKQGEEIILREVLPQDCQEAHRQGLIQVHSLSRFLDAELALLDLLGDASKSTDLTRALYMYANFQHAQNQATRLCIPHFDHDFSALFPKLSRDSIRGILSEFLAIAAKLNPGSTCSINVGAGVSSATHCIAQLLLEVLDSGPTNTNFSLVIRVRKGVNLYPGDPAYPMLQRALQLARHREGIGFALMDSPLNRQWVESVAYTGEGWRIEPLAGNLFYGTRGQFIHGAVSVDLERAQQLGHTDTEGLLRLAARALAQRSELSSFANAKRPIEPGVSIVNLVGLDTALHKDPVAVLAELRQMNGVVARLSGDYGLKLLLAAPQQQPCRAIPRANLLFEAQCQSLLPGGHCFCFPAGLHMSPEELYDKLLEAVNAGLSYIRFVPEDVRCLECHHSVVAPGHCPNCGCDARRRVLFYDGKLRQEIIRETL